MNPSILIAEDDPICAGLLRTALEATGYSVRVSADGYQAMAFSRDHVPALVILDFRLPGVDGIQVLGRFRLQAALRNVPVILYSDAPEAKRTAMPGTWVLGKSAGIAALLRIVERCLGAAAVRCGSRSGLEGKPQEAFNGGGTGTNFH